MKKPITVTIFGGYKSLERKLYVADIDFSVEDIFSNFWGKKYIIPYPTGKGAEKRAKEIENVLRGEINRL